MIKSRSIKNSTTLFFLLVLVFNSVAASGAGTHQLSPDITSATKAVDTVWQQFRKDFPFHIQAVAYDEESKTLIIAEPPPHVELKKLIETVPELQLVQEKRHTVGFDGWVKDFIFKLPELTSAERRDLFDRLNLYLFHTTYGSNVLPLPLEKPTFTNENTPLDIKVTFSDLKDWLLDKNEAFESARTGEQAQFGRIFSEKKGGVYFSKDSGLVIWVIDRKKPLIDNLAEVRQFAIDSDLIVGSVSNAAVLAIVARKRILPLSTLPPLRTETILQLASVKNPDLGQSYERNYVFAGRFNENDDWAPIYLSDELVDTEYGSLLNITDQILKRWSMKGSVAYQAFDSYKDPKEFPFGDKTLVEFLGNVPEVTFNWNTFGLGYSSEVNGKRIFAINRTGALPTSYLSEEQDNYSGAEEIGYKYFSEAGDPNLAKVVQYAALYQIFQGSEVTPGFGAFSFEKYVPKHDELYHELNGIIDEIRAVPLSDTARLSDFFGLPELASAVEKVKAFRRGRDFQAAAYSVLEPRNLNSQFNKKIEEYYRQKRKMIQDLRDLKTSIRSRRSQMAGLAMQEAEKVNQYNVVNGCPGPVIDGSARHQLCLRLDAELQGIRSRFYALERTTAAAEQRYNATIEQILNFDSTFGVFIDFSKALRVASKEFVRPSDVSRLKDAYLRSLPQRLSKFIHTPSIVISTNNDVGSVGGHNLNSKTTAFRVGVTPRGRVRVVQQGSTQVIIINAGDANKISQLTRVRAIKNGSNDSRILKADLEEELATRTAIEPVAKSKALELAGDKPDTQTTKLGYSTRSVSDGPDDSIIRITKRDDGTETVTYRNIEAETYSPTSRNDCLKNLNIDDGNAVRLELIGHTSDEANALIKSLMIPRRDLDRPGFFNLITGRNRNRLVVGYDFARAKVSQPRSEVVRTDGRDTTRVTVDIDVPHTVARTGLYFHVRTAFKGVLNRLKERQTIQKLQQLLERKFRIEKHDDGTDIQMIASEIENEMKLAFPDALESKVFFYDVTISENSRLTHQENANAE